MFSPRGTHKSSPRGHTQNPDAHPPGRSPTAPSAIACGGARTPPNWTPIARPNWTPIVLGHPYLPVNWTPIVLGHSCLPANWRPIVLILPSGTHTKSGCTPTRQISYSAFSDCLWRSPHPTELDTHRPTELDTHRSGTPISPRELDTHRSGTLMSPGELETHRSGTPISPGELDTHCSGTAARPRPTRSGCPRSTDPGAADLVPPTCGCPFGAVAVPLGLGPFGLWLSFSVLFGFLRLVLWLTLG